MTTLTGCTALITGASAGIGAELARQLAPRARCLILVARRADRLETLKGELTRPGLTVHCIAADLADEQSTGRLLQEIARLGQTITLLINNAGLGDHGLFEESEWHRVEAMLDVNIKALTRLTHALLPDLVRARKGAVLNVSSIASLLPVPRMAVYAATKAYVTSFSEALRAELRGMGVSVTALCPGPVETEFSLIAERPNSTETMPTPDFFKVPASQVAREALAAVQRDRARIIPGWLVCAIMTVVSLMPIFIVRVFLGKRSSRSRFSQAH